jgi:outer membrane receptor protein involved in Fe transport
VSTGTSVEAAFRCVLVVCLTRPLLCRGVRAFWGRLRLSFNGVRQEFPSYTKTDLHAGVRFDTWTVNAYVNNVTDRRGLLQGGIRCRSPSLISNPAH